MNNKIYNLLVKKGAIMSGHFVLTSGLHSNKYIEKFRVLEDPVSLSHICKEMANQFKDDNIDIVVGAAVGAILLSSGVARELGTCGIFTERVDGEMVFKRGFSIPNGARVLVVEDIVDTGYTLSHVISLLKSRGPSRLMSIALLDKPSRREVEVKADWTGFEIPDEFVVGYGIDYAQRNRNLDHIGKVRFTD